MTHAINVVQLSIKSMGNIDKVRSGYQANVTKSVPYIGGWMVTGLMRP